MSHIIEQIVNQDSLKNLIHNKIYDFLDESDSSKYYKELFSEDESVKNKKPEGYEQAKKEGAEKWDAYSIMEEIISCLEEQLDKDAVVIELGGGLYQGRAANAYKRFKNYFPLDISRTSISRYCSKYDKIGFVADATQLPFKDNSIDCIFSHTFLEHPLKPEEVLIEISRVLKPGGIIIHNDAWFCRWWHKYGIIEPFSKVSFKHKLVLIAKKITELSILRIPPVIIKRLLTGVKSNKKNIDLVYKKLEPNYSLHLGCDEDAASSIDPIDAIKFYESRDFTLLKPLTFKQRLFYPNKYIGLRKG